MHGDRDAVFCLMDMYLKAFQLKLLFRITGWHDASARARSLIVNQLVVTISKSFCGDNSYPIMWSDCWGMLEYNSRAFFSMNTSQAGQDWGLLARICMPTAWFPSYFTGTTDPEPIWVLVEYICKANSIPSCSPLLLPEEDISAFECLRWASLSGWFQVSCCIPVTIQTLFPFAFVCPNHYCRIGNTMTRVLLLLLSRPLLLTL